MVSRRDLDRYYTPDAVAQALVRRVPLAPWFAGRIWEPHAGRGAFVRAALSTWPRAFVTASDIDPGCVGVKLGHDSFVGDFFDDAIAPRSADVILGNPPFNEAERHVVRALSIASVGVGFLLRLGFLASLQRRSFFACHPPASVTVLQGRPSFTGDGRTDGQEYAWFWWGAGWAPHGSATTIDWCDWREAGDRA